MIKTIVRAALAALLAAAGAAASAGTLTGSSSTSTSSVTLNTYGTLDWAVYGNAGALPGQVSKSPSSGINLSYAPIGGATPTVATNGQRRFSWSGGSPSATGTSYSRVVSVTGAGKGISLSIPADAQTRTVRVYFDLVGASASFRASLSDGSAADYVSTATNSTSARQYTITYAANGPGRTLNLSMTLTGGSGTARLAAIGIPTFTYVNHAPTIAAPGTLNLQRNQAVAVSVTGADVDGDVLTYTATNLPPGLTINSSTGSITGTATVAGTFSTSVKVSDPTTANATATIVFTVSASSANTAPSSAGGTFTTAYETPVVFQPSWTDPDSGDSWTVTVLTQPSNGTASAAGTQVTYTPAAGYVGPDSFTIRVTDALSAFVDGTVTGTVTSIAPGQPAAPTVTQGTTNGAVQITWGATSNATSYDILRASSPSDPTPASLGNVATLTFTDSTAQPGVQYWYAVRAKNGPTVGIPSTAVMGYADTSPTALSGTFAAVLNSAVQVSINYTDPDAGDTGTFAIASQPSNGTATVASNVVTYTPNAGYVGADSFQVTVTDRAGASVTGSVTGTVAAMAPSQVTGVAATQGTSVGLVSLSWPAAANALSYRVLRGASPADPSPTVLGTSSSLSFTDNTAAPGVQYFYSVTALTVGQEAPASAAVPGYADTPPTAVGGTFAATLETPIVVSPSFTDPDPGDTAVFSIAAQPSNGSVAVAGNVITYSPNLGFVGTDSFQVTVTDRAGAAATGVLTGTVTAPTPAPVTGVSASQGTHVGAVNLSWPAAVNARSYRVLRGNSPSDPAPTTLGTVSALTYSDASATVGVQYYYSVQSVTIGQQAAASSAVLGYVDTPPSAVGGTFAAILETPTQVATSFTDPDSGDTAGFSIASQPSNGTVSVTNNVITYSPNLGFVGTDSFQVTVTDRAGATSTGTVTGTVTALAPASVTVLTASQGTFVGSVNLAWSAASNARSYRVLRGNSPSDPAPATVATVSALSFTDSTAAVGTQYHYSIQSLTVGQQAAPGSTVLGYVDTPPSSVGGSFSATLEVPLQVTPTFVDPDSGDTATFSIAAQPAHGSATVSSNVVTYTPNTGYVGADSFQVTVTDRAGASSTGVVSGVVTALVPAPVTGLTATQGTSVGAVSLTWSVASNARSYRVLRGSSPSDPAPTTLGTVSSVSYTDSSASAGTQYYYSVQSLTVGQQASPSSTVLGYADTPPTGASASFNTSVNTPVTFAPNFTDPDVGDIPTLTVTAAPVHGTVSILGTQFRYAPDPGYYGSDSFSFSVTDRAGASTVGVATGSVIILPPDPISGLTASLGGVENAVHLGWSPSVNATTYRIFRSTDQADPAPQQIGVVAGVTFTNSSLAVGQGFYYFVQPFNTTLAGQMSAGVYGYADTPPTAASATFQTLESQSITFVPTWTDPDVGDVHSLAITGQPAHGVASVVNNQLVYTPIAGYIGTDRFSFSVTDRAGSSTVGSASGTIEPGVPQAPLGFAATQGTVLGGVTLNWSNTIGSRQYLVSRSEVRGSSGSQVIATVDALFPNTFNDTNTTPGATYFYRIQGVGVAGIGPYSEEVSGYSDTPPSAASATASTIFNIPVGFQPAITDPDPNESHRLTILQAPANGVLTLNSDSTAFNYVPNSGFSGQDTFLFRAADVAGATIDGTGTVSVGCPTPTVSALTLSQPKIFANSGFTVATNYGNTACPSSLNATFEVLNGTTVITSQQRLGLPGAVSSPLSFAVDGLQPGSYALKVSLQDTVTQQIRSSTQTLVVPAYRMPSFTATSVVFADLDNATIAVGRSDDCTLTANRSAAIADHSLCYYEVTNIPPGLTFDSSQALPVWRGRPNTPGAYQPTLTVYQFDDLGAAKTLGQTVRSTNVQPVTALTFASPATIDAAQYIQLITVVVQQTSGPTCPVTTDRAAALSATLRGTRSCFVEFSPLPPRSTLTPAGLTAYFLQAGTVSVGWQVSTFDAAGVEVRFASGSSAINVRPVDVNFVPNWGDRNPIATVTRAAVHLDNQGTDRCLGTVDPVAANVPSADKPCLIEWLALPPGITQDAGTSTPLLTGIFRSVGAAPVSFRVSYFDVEGNKQILLESTKNVAVDPPPLPPFLLKSSRPLGGDHYTVPDTGGLLGIISTEVGSWPVDALIKWEDEPATTTWRINRNTGLQLLSATPAPLWTSRTVDIRLQLRDAPGLFTDKTLTVHSVPPDGIRLGLDVLNANVPDSENFPVTARIEMNGRNGPFYDATTMGGWAVQFGFKDSSSQFIPQGAPVPVDAQGVAVSSLNPFGQNLVRVQAFAVPITTLANYVRKLDSPLRVAVVVKGTPINATIGMFRGGTEGPAPFVAVLRTNFSTRSDQLANESVKWKVSSDGTNWSDVEADGLQITQRLAEGVHYYKAIFVNRNTHVASESNVLQLRAWAVPKVSFAGTTFAFPGTRTDLTIVLKHPNGDAVQSAVTEWSVNKRVQLAPGAPVPPPLASGSGTAVSFTATDPGSYVVTVRARMSASNAADPRAWGQGISTVNYGTPERPLARVIGPVRAEVGKPYRYELLVRTRFDLTATNMRLGGRWTYPDGTVVSGVDAGTYTATDQDLATGKFITLKYETWVVGYEADTLSTTTVSVPIWKYVWPTWSLSQSVVVPYAPTNSRITVSPNDPALLPRLEGLTYSWTVPQTMRVLNVPSSRLDTTIDYGGTHPVSVAITDSRGNSTTLSTTFVVGDAAPFVINVPVSNMSTWSHAPLRIGVSPKVSGGHPLDQVTSWTYYLDGVRLELPNRNTAQIIVETPGNHTIQVAVASKMGATATQSASINVPANVAATCEIGATTSVGKTALYLKANCVDPDGAIVRYQWSINGVLQTLISGYKWTYVVPQGTSWPVRIDLTVVDDGGGQSSSNVTVN